MIRKKVRVPQEAEFGAIVRMATRLCDVVLEQQDRRYFVVECDEESCLDPLRRLGCEIIEDVRYSLDRSGIPHAS
jgi:hypothetical protein